MSPLKPICARLVLALMLSRPVSWFVDWHSRALTAQRAAMFDSRTLDLRDVLPGLAYPPSGPWTHAELIATRPWSSDHVTEATPSSWQPCEQQSPIQAPKLACPAGESPSECLPAQKSTPRVPRGRC